MGYEIPGVGVIPGDVVAGICERFDTRIRRVLLDPASGTTVGDRRRRVHPVAGGAPVRHPPGRALPGPGLRPGGPVLRPGPRHPLAAGPDRRLEPADVVPAAPPDEAPDQLAGGDGRRRGVHLDRPVRPAVRHPPGQPPRHPRRLSRATSLLEAEHRVGEEGPAATGRERATGSLRRLAVVATGRRAGRPAVRRSRRRSAGSRRPCRRRRPGGRR